MLCETKATPAFESPNARDMKTKIMGKETVGAPNLTFPSFPSQKASTTLYIVCMTCVAIIGQASLSRAVGIGVLNMSTLVLARSIPPRGFYQTDSFLTISLIL